MKACVMNELITKHGNHKIQKINDFEFRLERNERKGMNVPVTIFSDDLLISKMVSDRTIDQARLASFGSLSRLQQQHPLFCLGEPFWFRDYLFEL